MLCVPIRALDTKGTEIVGVLKCINKVAKTSSRFGYPFGSKDEHVASIIADKISELVSGQSAKMVNAVLSRISHHHKREFLNVEKISKNKVVPQNSDDYELVVTD